MLLNIKNLVISGSQALKKCEMSSCLNNGTLSNITRCLLCSTGQKQNFHTSPPFNKSTKLLLVRKAALDSAKKKEQILSSFSGSIWKKRDEGYFPTVDLPNTLFDNVPFKELPIVHVKASRNNTILALTERGRVKVLRSCGMDGFKNCRKGTNVAAQVTGTSFGHKIFRFGYKTVKVIVQGLGPGRLSALKGMQLSGVNIISITDKTIDDVSRRPRKARRI